MCAKFILCMYLIVSKRTNNNNNKIPSMFRHWAFNSLFTRTHIPILLTIQMKKQTAIKTTRWSKNGIRKKKKYLWFAKRWTLNVRLSHLTFLYAGGVKCKWKWNIWIREHNMRFILKPLLCLISSLRMVILRRTN